ncbi:MAG TPA: GspH/FimT family protein [Phycisphaerales bacterium]|nr:GspH/FimT family protein [Phycisphaerales bacterium]HRQ75202.1 GspH/FimT family protein [Phycisphaerales bacterium]
MQLKSRDFAIERRTRRSNRIGGFTLIELIAIIVILAILAGAAMPAMNSLNAARPGAAARHLLNDLAFARQYAIATGTPCWVSFDVNANTWHVMHEDAGMPGFAGASTVEDRATGRPYVVELGVAPFQGVQITAISLSGSTRIGFNWLGQPLIDDDAVLPSQGQVTLSGNHRVRIEPVTGLAEYIAP